MPVSLAKTQPRSGFRLSLGGVMIVIAVLALLLSILSRAAQSGSSDVWGIVVLTLGLFLFLAIPVFILSLVSILGLVIRPPSSREDEREVIGLVVITFLLIILLCLSVLIIRL